MRLSEFHATKVHGYLPLEITFHAQLTFITGVNGSGKTSALRLLMALITPNIQDFINTEFETASVTVRDSGFEIIIQAIKSVEKLTLTISGVPETLELNAAQQQFLLEHKRQDASTQPIATQVLLHPVTAAIKKLSTPMYLGLDRRFFGAPFPNDDTEERRRELVLRRNSIDPRQLRQSGDLADVSFLVHETMSEIRAAQESLDADLRNKLLIGAFQYKHSEYNQLTGMPSASDLVDFRKRQQRVEEAARQLNLPLDEVKSALSGFFEKMNQLLKELEIGQDKFPAKEASFVEWLMNKSQAERIFSHIRLLDDFSANRAKLHEPIERFLKLINGFLVQTDKELRMTDKGYLYVVLKGHSEERPITALSSGERQLVVMLGHLALNRALAGSSVFIVDEPELSLHIGWQERFVDAIHQANSGVQLIMATHSPAIILDRLENCRSL